MQFNDLPRSGITTKLTYSYFKISALLFLPFGTLDSMLPSFRHPQNGTKSQQFFIDNNLPICVSIFSQAAVKRMEKDPLRWHGGIKVSMAVALNEGMQGLIQNFPTVSNLVQM